VPLAESHHVVVDGSNLATEGRTSPSLGQLDEAVQAYAAEDPGSHIIVVVDATFEHRVTESEREEVREAMLNGELVSPPAGAIGRGDAFVLRIAERTGALVLSNDSFQEFHGEHPWLFDEGRLIGGKPVPGVGWIFTPRLPIRGPKSRVATAEARSKAKKDPSSAPAKAAELARAAKKAAKRSSKAKKTEAPTPLDTAWPLVPALPPPGRAKVDPVFSSAIDEALEEALRPPEPAKPKSETKKAAGSSRRARGKKRSGKGDDGRGPKGPDAPSEPAPGEPVDGQGSSNRRSTPLPAVNEPLAFINFVAAFAVGSTIEGEVVSFTSHGAMVDVPLPAGGVLHCYIPLSAMGSPAPTKARQVLKKGEVRSFTLAGLDPPRRVAELELPASANGPLTGLAERGETTGPGTPAQKAAQKSAKKAPAKKAAGVKKAPAKKAAARKASAKKAGAKKVAKTAASIVGTSKTSSPTQKATKKASAKKVAAKKAGVKKASTAPLP
jgi:hypothetical protein